MQFLQCLTWRFNLAFLSLTLPIPQSSKSTKGIIFLLSSICCQIIVKIRGAIIIIFIEARRLNSWKNRRCGKMASPVFFQTKFPPPGSISIVATLRIYFVNHQTLKNTFWPPSSHFGLKYLRSSFLISSPSSQL